MKRQNIVKEVRKEIIREQFMMLGERDSNHEATKKQGELIKKEVQLLNTKVKNLQKVAGESQKTLDDYREVIESHEDIIQTHEKAIYRGAEYMSTMSTQVVHSDARNKNLISKIKEQEGTIKSLKSKVHTLTKHIASLTRRMNFKKWPDKLDKDSVLQRIKNNEEKLSKLTSKTVDKQSFGENTSKVNVEKLKEIITTLRNKTTEQDHKIHNILNQYNILAKIVLEEDALPVNILGPNGENIPYINDHDIDLMGDVA